MGLVEHQVCLRVEHIIICAVARVDFPKLAVRESSRRDDDISDVPCHPFEPKRVCADEVFDKLGKVGQPREVDAIEYEGREVEEARRESPRHAPVGRPKCRCWWWRQSIGFGAEQLQRVGISIEL